MEGHRSRRPRLIAGVALAATLLAATVGPTRASQDQVGAGVDPSGVTIMIVRWQDEDRVHATATDGGADPTGCDWAVHRAPLGSWPPADLPPWRPDSYLGLLTCNGVGVTVIWVGPHNTVDLAAEARRLVEAYVARVPVPRITVRANPEPGLVGVEAWWWIEGFDGQPIIDRIDALGIGVDVRIDPTTVTWRYGDGTTAPGGRGAAYPQRSDVRHVYLVHGERTVTARLDLVPRYRIDDADWIELPGIPLAARRAYRVREAQAVLTRSLAPVP